MTVLLFDANALSLSDAQLVRDETLQWSEANPLWLTSIVTTGARLNVISDFADRSELVRVLRSDAFQNAIVAPGAIPQAVRFGGSRAAQDSAAAAQRLDPPLLEQRLRGIATMCETLGPIPQRKTIIYFSSSLSAAAAVDSATPGTRTLRAVTDRCSRTNVTIYPIDTSAVRAAVGGSNAN